MVSCLIRSLSLPVLTQKSGAARDRVVNYGPSQPGRFVLLLASVMTAEKPAIASLSTADYNVRTSRKILFRQ